jgi:DNA-binding transcriptional regulator YbjK
MRLPSRQSGRLPEAMEAASPTRPGRPRDERASEAILQAALGQLLERGYGGMSMEGVAAAAGVGKPAIYRRHRNKAELVTAAIWSILPVVELPDTGSTRDDIHAVASQARPMTEGPFAMLLGTVIAEQVRQPELIEAFRERIVRPRRRLIKTILERGMERGEVRRNLDVEQAADALIGNVIGRHISGLEFDDVWFESAIEFFWRGIRA